MLAVASRCVLLLQSKRGEETYISRRLPLVLHPVQRLHHAVQDVRVVHNHESNLICGEQVPVTDNLLVVVVAVSSSLSAAATKNCASTMLLPPPPSCLRPPLPLLGCRCLRRRHAAAATNATLLPRCHHRCQAGRLPPAAAALPPPAPPSTLFNVKFHLSQAGPPPPNYRSMSGISPSL